MKQRMKQKPTHTLKQIVDNLRSMRAAGSITPELYSSVFRELTKPKDTAYTEKRERKQRLIQRCIKTHGKQMMNKVKSQRFAE